MVYKREVRPSARGVGNLTAKAGQPPAGRLLPACIKTAPSGILTSAMTAMNYIESEVPENMVLAEWRRKRAAARRRVRRTPRFRLRLA